jgi:hypothetical protein
MADPLDLLDAFNWIDRAQGVLMSLRHARPRRRARQRGEAGSWTFQIPRTAGWSGADIERFLNRYGIIVWGRRVTSQYLIFTVKRRQANWAEYLLLRRGIPVATQPYNSLNTAYGAAHAPGDAPPAWADRSPARQGLLDAVLSIFR